MFGTRRLLKKLSQPLHRHFGVITRVTTEAPVFAPTFDDGPHPHWTPRVLDVLARHHAHATFFMVGAMVERYPDLVSRVVAEGHSVGNHSWNHPSLPRVSGHELARQIDWTSRFPPLAESRLFRPPFGDLDRRTRMALANRRLRVVTWDVVLSDWEPRSVAELGAALRRIQSGSIVLMHDQLFAFSGGDECDRQHLLQALDAFLAESERRAVSLSELLTMGRPKYEPWRKESDVGWLSGLDSYEDLGFVHAA